MKSILRTTWRVLTFRATPAELHALDGRHFAFGLVCTWLVGIGRYWDDPRADALQHCGAGSVVYVFVLALLLFLVTWGIVPCEASYRRILTFVTLTSPPAALYAIPVERFTSVAVASTINAWFLALVALWRVSLWLGYLRRAARCNGVEAAVAGLLPLTVVVTVLTLLSLEHVTFDRMGGLRDPTPNDGAYRALFLLAMASTIAVVPLLAFYVILVVLARKRRRRSRSITRGSAAS